MRFYEDKCAALEQANNDLQTSKQHLEQELSRVSSLGNTYIPFTAMGSGSLNPNDASRGNGRSQLDESISAFKSQLLSAQTELAGKNNELLKSNDIIRKLQEELRASKQKQKSISGISTQQEQIIKDLQETLQTQRQDLQQARQSGEGLRGELTERDQTIRRLQLDIVEKGKQVTANEKIIAFLHEQLNESVQKRVENRLGLGGIGSGGVAGAQAGRTGGGQAPLPASQTAPSAANAPNLPPGGFPKRRLSPETLKGKESATSEVF